MASIVQYLSREGEYDGSKCGYCKKTSSSFSNGMWAYQLRPLDYQRLIDRGWRRSGHYCYKPQLQRTCCPQYTIRCDALAFKPTKSQKKIMKRLNRFLLDGRQEEKSEAEDTRAATRSDEIDMCNREKANLKMDTIALDLKDCRPKERSLKIDENVLDENVLPKVTLKDENIGDSTSKQMEPGHQTKRKHMRRQRWAEKHKNEVKPAKVKKDTEKSLEDWLTFPTGGKHRLELRLVRTSSCSDEAMESEAASFDLYARYQTKIHRDKPEDCTKRTWKNFLVDSPLIENCDPLEGSFHQQYWLDDRLICVAVLDILPYCVSSVYFYYDPEFSHLSLGTLSSLMEIKLVRSLHQEIPSLKYYYMGFYIHSCPKMRYKANLPNSYLLCPETYSWHAVEKCLPLLDAADYTRFESDRSKGDPPVGSPQDISIIYKHKQLSYDGYTRLKKLSQVERDEIGEYCRLVGSHLTDSLILYRQN